MLYLDGARHDVGGRGCGGLYLLLFFFNDTATTEIYTLSLHDALPISTGSLSTSFRRLAFGPSSTMPLVVRDRVAVRNTFAANPVPPAASVSEPAMYPQLSSPWTDPWTLPPAHAFRTRSS